VAEAFVTWLEAQALGTPALSAGSLRRGVRSLPGSASTTVRLASTIGYPLLVGDELCCPHDRKPAV